MGKHNRISMAYVAFCVTLTCTAATMTTAGLSYSTTAPSPIFERATPAEIQAERHGENRQGPNRFFARTHRLNRTHRKLAIGGLSV